MGLITWLFLFNLKEKELKYLLYFILTVLLPISLFLGFFNYFSQLGSLGYYCTMATIVFSLMICITLFAKTSKNKR